MAKQAKTTTTTLPQVAIAPTHPLGQGHAQKGGHVLAWRQQAPLPLTATVTFAPGFVNPWRPNTPGSNFCNAAIMPYVGTGATVQEILAAAQQALGLKPNACQGHLRWLYTWPHCAVQVNGLTWGQTQTS